MQREIAELLEHIAPPGSFAVSRSAPAELSAAGDDGLALARWLAARQWEWIEAAVREAENEPSPTRAGARLKALAAAAAAVLRSIARIRAFDHGEEIVTQLAATRTERRVDFLMALLRATAERDDDVAPDLSAVRELASTRSPHG